MSEEKDRENNKGDNTQLENVTKAYSTLTPENRMFVNGAIAILKVVQDLNVPESKVIN